MSNVRILLNVRYAKGDIYFCYRRKVERNRDSTSISSVFFLFLLISSNANQRLKMYPKKDTAGDQGKFEPFALNQPLEGLLLGEVLESMDAKFAVGDKVVTMGQWQKYIVVESIKARKAETSVSESIICAIIAC